MVCGKKASTAEIVATLANQIVPLKFQVEVQKCHQTSLSFCSVEGESGNETTTQVVTISDRLLCWWVGTEWHIL